MTLDNPWFIFLLVSVTGLFLLEVVSVLLNVKHLRQPLPVDFEDVFDAETFARSQAYSRESARHQVVAAGVRLAVFLGFWLAGGFVWL